MFRPKVTAALAAVAIAGGLTLAAGPASAGNVAWSVSVGGPGLPSAPAALAIEERTGRARTPVRHYRPYYYPAPIVYAAPFVYPAPVVVSRPGLRTAPL